VATTSYHQYNFPNPFNLKDKTVSLRPGTSGVGTSIRGTYIVVSPTGSGSVNARIRIYNTAGDMVREFNTPATAGQYNYIEWDGRNTAGDDVASGVYFATVDAPGAEQERGDLTPLIDSEVKFKSEEPAHATFPPCGNTLEYPMLPDAFVVTDVKGRAVYEIC
jgi:hypothetical protein